MGLENGLKGYGNGLEFFFGGCSGNARFNRNVFHLSFAGDAGPAMRAIADFIAKPSTDEAISMVEHPACHIAMKKIIAHDKTRMEQGEGSKF